MAYRGHRLVAEGPLTAGSLAEAVTSSRPAAHRDRLVNRMLALRTATVEAVATAQRAGTFAPAWIFLATAEDLTRALVGPDAPQPPPDGGADLAARLRVIAAQCDPATPPAPGPAGDCAPATRAGFDVSRMAAAVAALQERLHQPQRSDTTGSSRFISCG